MLKRSTPLKRTASLKRSGPLRRVSKKRAAQNRIYGKKRAAFFEAHPICQVWLKEEGWTEHKNNSATKKYLDEIRKICPIVALSICENAPLATEIHHVNKRRGEMLNDERFWLAVCSANHRRIEDNKSWARERGFLKDF